MSSCELLSLIKAYVAALSDSFWTILIAYSCLISCPASVLSMSDSFEVVVPSTSTTKASNLSIGKLLVGSLLCIS